MRVKDLQLRSKPQVPTHNFFAQLRSVVENEGEDEAEDTTRVINIRRHSAR
jgi:hypothetical protein